MEQHDNQQNEGFHTGETVDFIGIEWLTWTDLPGVQGVKKFPRGESLVAFWQGCRKFQRRAIVEKFLTFPIGWGRPLQPAYGAQYSLQRILHGSKMKAQHGGGGGV